MGKFKKLNDFLDMSHKSRMERAAEMGYDTAKKWYHGTAGNIKRFKPELSGAGSGLEHDIPVHWFTNEPKAAGEYAEIAGDNKLFKRGPKLDAKFDKIAHDRDSGRISPEEWADRFTALNREIESTGQNILPAHLKMQNPYLVDAKGKLIEAHKRTEIIKRAQAQGHDGVVFQNIPDSRDNDIVSDVAAVFQPKQIRSPHATFDPAKKNSKNILDAVAAPIAVAGTLGLASQSEASEAIKNPLKHGIMDVGSNALTKVDQYTGQPVRAGVNAAIKGKNPLTAYLDSMGSDTPTTGEDVARSFLEKSPQLGFPTPQGGREYPLQQPLGMAADFALDPTNLPVMAVPKAVTKFPKLIKYLR